MSWSNVVSVERDFAGPLTGSTGVSSWKFARALR